MVRRNTLTGGRCEERIVRRSNLLTLFLIFVLAGCVTAPPTPTAVPVIEATATPQPTSAPIDSGPTFVGRVRNAQYQLGTPDTVQVVQLTDGAYETGTAGGADYVSVNVLNYVASGDLNSDGKDEVVALVAENYGGSGVFVFLAVYADINGTLTFQTSLMIDDRPSVNAMSIDNGEVFLDVVVHGADDPFCCPTLHTSRHYRLTRINQLDIVDYATFTPAGTPRTITIDAPPNGAQASNSIQVRGKVAIAPFENTLAYRIYDVGGVELAAGSINVTTPDLGAPGTFDSVIKLGSILSGAVIRLEIQDISARDSSLLAMDSVELVVK
jgi:hypothetical protein